MLTLGIAPLYAQPPKRTVSAADLPAVAEAALKGLEVRVGILSGTETKPVVVALDSSLLSSAVRERGQSGLQRSASTKRVAGTPVTYKVKLYSIELLSDSTARAISTIQIRPSGGCDTKTVAVMLVKRENGWQANLVTEIVAPECRRGG